VGPRKIDNIIQMKPLSKLPFPNGNVWLALGKQSLLLEQPTTDYIIQLMDDIHFL
jgi:hypothetical protein